MATVLIMDDCEMVAMALHDAVAEAGYDVLNAAEGEEGIKLCRENKVDVVITDILMPGKEGIETIFELRRDFPLIQIIAISGGGGGRAGDYLTIARQSGAAKTFTTPFRMNQMLEAIEELCVAAANKKV
jgi:DNA-binding NarL/FixJ family response regulator